jgi:hypothetical protein
VGVIFSSRRWRKKTIQSSQGHQVNKKKVVSVLRHHIMSLKKVARMSAKERTTFIKVLKK